MSPPSIKSTITDAMLNGENGFIAPPQAPLDLPIPPPPRPPHLATSSPTPDRPGPAASTSTAAAASTSASTSNQAHHLLNLPDGLEHFTNGDIVVDPSQASGVVGAGMGSGTKDEHVDMVKVEEKGKRGGRKRKQAGEGEDIKPIKKRNGGQLAAIVLLSPDLVLPPAVERFALSTDHLAQLNKHFGMDSPSDRYVPFNTDLPRPDQVYPSKEALWAAIEVAQRQRGHRIRVVSTYSPTRLDALVFACAYAGTKGARDDFTRCGMRVRCQPVPRSDGSSEPPDSTGEFLIRKVDCWEHSHPPIDELEGEEYVPPAVAPCVEKTLVRGQEADAVAAAVAKRRKAKKPVRSKPIKPQAKDTAGLAKQHAVVVDDGAADGVGNGLVGPSRPKYGRGKTIPPQSMPAPDEENGDSSGSEWLDPVREACTQERRLEPSETLGPIPPRRPLSPASSAGSSTAPAASPEWRLDEPEPPNSDHPFDTWGLPNLPRSQPAPFLTGQEFAQLLAPATAPTDSSLSPNGPELGFDSPNSVRTADTAATSPPAPNFLGGGENPHGLVNLAGLGAEAGTTDLIAPLQTTLADTSSNGCAPDLSATGAFNFDLAELPLFRPGTLPGPNKTPLSEEELKEALSNIEPGLEAVFQPLHSAAGMGLNTVGRANAFLHELEPAEIEAAVGAKLTGTSLNGRIAGQALARAVEGRRAGKGREEGLGGGVQM